MSVSEQDRIAKFSSFMLSMKIELKHGESSFARLSFVNLTTWLGSSIGPRQLSGTNTIKAPLGQRVRRNLCRNFRLWMMYSSTWDAMTTSNCPSRKGRSGSWMMYYDPIFAQHLDSATRKLKPFQISITLILQMPK